MMNAEKMIEGSHIINLFFVSLHVKLNHLSSYQR